MKFWYVIRDWESSLGSEYVLKTLNLGEDKKVRVERKKDKGMWLRGINNLFDFEIL